MNRLLGEDRLVVSDVAGTTRDAIDSPMRYHDRDFVFIDDLVDVVISAIHGEGEKGYYHISSGSDYSIKELFDETVNALNITLENEVEVRPRNPDDVFTILIDPSKTNKDFNWKTKTSLNEGVKRAIEWYKVHGITQTYTHLKPVEKN